MGVRGLQEAGVFYVSASESLDTTTPIGRGTVALLVSVAEQESANTSYRMQQFYEQLAADGRPKGNGPRPFGYGDDWLTVRPEEAALIREAANRILAGDSLLGICEERNAKSIRTARGKEWRPRSLKILLISLRVAGYVQHHGEMKLDGEGKPVRAVWPAILDEDTWVAVREKLTDPSRRRHFNQGQRLYLLTGKRGVGFCSCGNHLQARPRKNRKTKEPIRAYACGGGSCGVSILADDLEGFVREAVIEALSSHRLDQLLQPSMNGTCSTAFEQRRRRSFTSTMSTTGQQRSH